MFEQVLGYLRLMLPAPAASPGGKYFIGQSDVKEGDIIVQITRSQMNQQLRHSNEACRLAFAFRQVNDVGKLHYGNHFEAEKREVFRFVGYCYAYRVEVEFDKVKADERYLII
ncbi:hypothetical protein G7Y89_g15287 [Cudoniella acicularis]|uniref:Uncharacterized protein n=1 Tax=Cudoniella acicularis TaxID=354080 RepID=A0A8H4QQN9_9HELO|nr:hypothetical protein G7Y89_g15287 [Cudoniella acicularis]